jgi:hypothetical protein
VLRNRLALGFAHSAPSTRLFVCWQDQFEDFDLGRTTVAFGGAACTKGAPARMVETGEYKAKNNICFLFAMMLLCSSSFSTGAP